MLRRWTRILRGRYVRLAVCLGVAALLALVLWIVLGAGGAGFSTKTLWDLLQLLIIPIVLGVGAWLFNRAERRADRYNSLDRQREATLTTYLDRMSDLLLRYDLRTSDSGSEAHAVAVARTVSALRSLDGPRIVQVIWFLTASGLGGTKLLEIDLTGTNLQGADFRKADLQGAHFLDVNLQGAILMAVNLQEARLVDVNLQGANLWGADLREADLPGANLQGANLTGAKLQGAHLWYANLQGANLWRANLQGAILGTANLQGAHLKEAIVTPYQLEQVAEDGLENATMPDGTKYQDWVARGRPDWT